MLTLLNAVGFMRDKDSAMQLLRTAPAPYKPGGVILSTGHPFPFVAKDIDALVLHKRVDLAEVILERTADVNVLYETAAKHSNSALLKAITRNYLCPTALLLDVHLDQRKTIQAAARSALSRKLGTRVADTEEYLATLRELLYLDEGDLAGVIDAVCTSWPTRAVEAALSLVLDRPGGVTDDLFSQVSTRARRLIARNPNGAFARAIVGDPRTGIQQLDSILGASPGYGSKSVVSLALLDRLEPNSDRWLDVLASYSEYEAVPTALEPYMKLLSPQGALKLLNRSHTGGDRAIVSGKIQDKLIVEIAHRWLDRFRGSDTRGEILSSHVLAHPSVDGELLASLIGASLADSSARIALAANPNLTQEQQSQFLREDPTRRALAANTSISAETARSLGEMATGTGSRAGSNSVLSWSNQTTVANLLANPCVPSEVKGQLPARVLVGRHFDTNQGVAPAAAVVDTLLGGGAERWKMFLDLLPEWEGSIGDLAAAVKSL